MSNENVKRKFSNKDKEKSFDPKNFIFYFCLGHTISLDAQYHQENKARNIWPEDIKRRHVMLKKEPKEHKQCKTFNPNIFDSLLYLNTNRPIFLKQKKECKSCTRYGSCTCDTLDPKTLHNLYTYMDFKTIEVKKSKKHPMNETNLSLEKKVFIDYLFSKEELDKNKSRKNGSQINLTGDTDLTGSPTTLDTKNKMTQQYLKGDTDQNTYEKNKYSGTQNGSSTSPVTRKNLTQNDLKGVTELNKSRENQYSVNPQNGLPTSSVTNKNVTQKDLKGKTNTFGENKYLGTQNGSPTGSVTKKYLTQKNLKGYTDPNRSEENKHLVKQNGLPTSSVTNKNVTQKDLKGKADLNTSEETKHSVPQNGSQTNGVTKKNFQKDTNLTTSGGKKDLSSQKISPRSSDKSFSDDEKEQFAKISGKGEQRSVDKFNTGKSSVKKSSSNQKIEQTTKNLPSIDKNKRIKSTISEPARDSEKGYQSPFEQILEKNESPKQATDCKPICSPTIQEKCTCKKLSIKAKVCPCSSKKARSVSRIKVPKNSTGKKYGVIYQSVSKPKTSHKSKNSNKNSFANCGSGKYNNRMAPPLKKTGLLDFLLRAKSLPKVCPCYNFVVQTAILCPKTILKWALLADDYIMGSDNTWSHCYYQLEDNSFFDKYDYVLSKKSNNLNITKRAQTIINLNSDIACRESRLFQTYFCYPSSIVWQKNLRDCLPEVSITKTSIVKPHQNPIKLPSTRDKVGLTITQLDSVEREKLSCDCQAGDETAFKVSIDKTCEAQQEVSDASIATINFDKINENLSRKCFSKKSIPNKDDMKINKVSASNKSFDFQYQERKNCVGDKNKNYAGLISVTENAHSGKTEQKTLDVSFMPTSCQDSKSKNKIKNCFPFENLNSTKNRTLTQAVNTTSYKNGHTNTCKEELKLVDLKLDVNILNGSRFEKTSHQSTLINSMNDLVCNTPKLSKQTLNNKEFREIDVCTEVNNLIENLKYFSTKNVNNTEKAICTDEKLQKKNSSKKLHVKFKDEVDTMESESIRVDNFSEHLHHPDNVKLSNRNIPERTRNSSSSIKWNDEKKNTQSKFNKHDMSTLELAVNHYFQSNPSMFHR